MDSDEEDGEWTKIERGNKIKKKIDPYYILLSNRYASLPAFSAPPDPPQLTPSKVIPTQLRHQSRHRLKVEQRRQKRRAAKLCQLRENEFFDDQITFAEDESTTMAKNDQTNAMRITIDQAHAAAVKPVASILHRGRNFGYALSTAFKRAIKFIKADEKRVRFSRKDSIATFTEESKAIMITYDSGADSNYISEQDRIIAGLPILRKSTKRVEVANGGTSNGKFVTSLPFAQLSKQAAEADTFTDFSSSLLSVGKTADDGNISIFTKEGVSVHKEEDVLITCRGKPVLIGKRDEYGRYRIPLIQR